MTVKAKPIMKAEKTGKATTATKAGAKPSYEELEKQVKELSGKLSKVPEELEEQIRFFEEKKDLIIKRDRIVRVENSLIEHGEKLKAEEKEDELVSKEYAIRLSSEYSYGNREDQVLIRIQNPVLIEAFIEKLLEVTAAKRAEYEKAIQAY